MNAMTSIFVSPRDDYKDHGVTEADFFWPLAIIAGLLLLVCTMGTHFTVRAFNSSSAVREQILAANGIKQRVDEVAQMVVPQVMWDDAVLHLDNSFDEAWAANNIGGFLHQIDKFDESYIVDSNDWPIFASKGGVVTAPAVFRSRVVEAAPLLVVVRALERVRGPIKLGKDGALVARPIQSSALKMIEGKLVIVTATLVQPDFGKSLPRGARAPTVITTMPVNQPFLDVFARRYMLDRLHVVAQESAIPDGEVGIPARDEHRRTIAWFAWKPLDPGYVMLRSILGPVLIIAVLFAILAFSQLHKIHVAARKLLDHENRDDIDFAAYERHFDNAFDPSFHRQEAYR